MKSLAIRVTRDDIQNGETESATRCPIARAIRRLGKKKWISVVPYQIELGDAVYQMPETARNFLDRFDDGLAVEPFSFTMTQI